MRPVASHGESMVRFAWKIYTDLVLALGSVIVEVEADDGTIGVGVSIGGEPACFIIENHLSRFVEGEDPRYYRESNATI